jgi:O-antigen/teichoic acid export membrane protein
MDFYDRSMVKQLASFGAYNVIVNAADRVVIATDLILITAILPAATKFYANGALLPPYLMQMVLMVTWTMTPYATACDSKGDRPALRTLLLNGTRGSLFLAAAIGSGLLFTGSAFLHQWINPALLDSQDYANAGVILMLLTWATLVRASSSCGRQVCSVCAGCGCWPDCRPAKPSSMSVSASS